MDRRGHPPERRARQARNRTGLGEGGRVGVGGWGGGAGGRGMTEGIGQGRAEDCAGRITFSGDGYSVTARARVRVGARDKVRVRVRVTFSGDGFSTTARSTVEMTG